MKPAILKRPRRQRKTNVVVETEPIGDNLATPEINDRPNFALFQLRANDDSLSDIQQADLAQAIVNQCVVWQEEHDDVVYLGAPR